VSIKNFIGQIFITKKWQIHRYNRPTLASIKTWGIQRELVICRHKDDKKAAFFKIYIVFLESALNFKQ